MINFQTVGTSIHTLLSNQSPWLALIWRGITFNARSVAVQLDEREKFETSIYAGLHRLFIESDRLNTRFRGLCERNLTFSQPAWDGMALAAGGDPPEQPVQTDMFVRPPPSFSIMSVLNRLNNTKSVLVSYFNAFTLV